MSIFCRTFSILEIFCIFFVQHLFFLACIFRRGNFSSLIYPLWQFFFDFVRSSPVLFRSSFFRMNKFISGRFYVKIVKSCEKRFKNCPWPKFAEAIYQRKLVRWIMSDEKTQSKICPKINLRKNTIKNINKNYERNSRYTDNFLRRKKC